VAGETASSRVQTSGLPRKLPSGLKAFSLNAPPSHTRSRTRC
jgi:hypothetical protein